VSPPLLKLLFLKQRAWLRHQIRSLKSPRRLVAFLATAALITVRVVTMHLNRGAPSDAHASVAVLGAMLFVLSLASGFLQQGPRFTPSDIDFLFPTPISPRGLLLFRLLHLWPLTLFSSAFMVLMFGTQAGSPWRLLVGLFALQVTAVHLQLLISVLLTRASAAAAKRLRGTARSAALAVLFVGISALIFTITEQGGIASVVEPVARAPIARFLFFPAAACADFVFADRTATLLLSLARLAVGVAGTGMLLMVPEIDFREESIETTARVSRLIAQRRRGETMIDLEGRRVRSRTGEGALFFRGAAALVWKNGVVFSRSLRSVLSAVAFGLVFVLPILFTARPARYGVGASPVGAFVSIGALMMLTSFASNAFNFDLRREVARIDQLRALPLPASSIVLAELFLPWILCVALQEAIVAAISWFSTPQQSVIALFALLLPVASFVMVVVDNLALFVFAPKPGNVSPRGSLAASSPAQMLRLIVWAFALAPAAFAWGLARGHVSDLLAALAAAGVECVIALALFLLLVRSFERREFDTTE
jgi:putative ABC exporter